MASVNPFGVLSLEGTAGGYHVWAHLLGADLITTTTRPRATKNATQKFLVIKNWSSGPVTLNLAKKSFRKNKFQRSKYFFEKTSLLVAELLAWVIFRPQVQLCAIWPLTNSLSSSQTSPKGSESAVWVTSAGASRFQEVRRVRRPKLSNVGNMRVTSGASPPCSSGLVTLRQSSWSSFFFYVCMGRRTLMHVLDGQEKK
ncbi:hypothetical protein TcasGA2_TC014739 [Tribolium castaneum]|uniref:Uncharacterized protein n=1 Tax=Tribolium castaneum TaxID=7070 RepID=D6WJ83_TRICA|nr:hypothetical protein TcasGA2_TC014739 [Tribolium castaneum]